MEKNSKIFVAGHSGLVGSAVHRKLIAEGYTNIVTRTHMELDLRNQKYVARFFNEYKPEYVFLCAAKVGGIMANNTQRAEFIYDNLMIQTNVIHSAYLFACKKLLFLGSGCIYPTKITEAISEEKLLTGELEPTNEPYAIAKIAGVKMCEAYRDQYGFNAISAMPCNLFGINDHYDLQKSHVLPALIRKFMVAKNKNEDVTLWGDGTPIREFMYSDDVADAALFLMLNYNEKEHINVGTGANVQLNVLAKMIAKEIGFEGKILHDTSKPNGMKVRLIDVSKINKLGWKSKISLSEGLKRTIEDIYKTNKHLEWL